MTTVFETLEAIQAFLSSPGGGIFQLLVGITLEALYGFALFYWKPLAFVPGWVAVVLTSLLAFSSGHRGIALMFALLAVLNLIEIPFLRLWYRKRRQVEENLSEMHPNVP
jgi:hypothetical protein